MGAATSGFALHRRQGRRWTLGAAELDEASWSLTVRGRRVPIEAKPLEVLHELLLRANEVVTKDELLDAVWPDVVVVEASVPTAILKLRRALGDLDASTVIETVPRIGYRLACPVEIAMSDPGARASAADPQRPADLAGASRASFGAAFRGPARLAIPSRRASAAIAAAALCGMAVVPGVSAFRQGSTANEPPAISQRDARDALRRLDVGKIEALLRAGWNPNTPFDAEGNGALNIALEVCEWNPGHDPQKLVLMARTLFDGGAKLENHNIWGDTAYSIASAKRYCGPDHPVTKMIRTECNSGLNPLGDKCLASHLKK